jgi:MFS family permease
MNVRVSDASPADAGLSNWLSREHIVAKAGFNRWLVPPAALAIHLCIGMSYGLSVFWLPLSRALSVGQPSPAACPDMTVATALFTTTCDWRVSDLVTVFSIGIVMLGIAAAVFGGWLERAGPRKAGLAAALCWGGGFLIGAVGVHLHQLWLVWLGMGVIGGIGLGLGYISPVSTLVKWFPDRRGMATGMAIMGFGGGAMIGSPLANILINTFKTANSAGVWETLAVMGVLYLVAMTCGALGYRVPPAGWRPEGWTAPASKSAMITSGHVHLDNAHKTPQFWLLWTALALNVSAGIGVLALASPMLQEIFGGALIGQPGLAFSQLDGSQKAQIAAVAAGFVGLLSLFNILGRFFWASMSDKIGRKVTYATFFALGCVLYAAAPWAAGIGSKGLFVVFFCVILSMYGGGFSTIPAYLADVFGTQFVGAIHGRLLTAWSTAGVVGPFVVTAIRQAQVDAGIQGAELYTRTMYILAGFLAVGFVANLLVRPLAVRWFMSDAEVAAAEAKGSTTSARLQSGSYGIGRGGFSPLAGLAWMAVGIPILWGIWTTVSKTLILFS